MRNVILTFFLAYLFLQCGIVSNDKDQAAQPAKKGPQNHCPAFYFVRHGETDWGKEDILKGPQDLELNQVGIQQATQAGIALKLVLGHTSVVNWSDANEDNNKNTVKIISSPLKRATQTAEKIAEITDFPILARRDGLRERYYGDYRLLVNADNTQTPPDAETTEIFESRVMDTLHQMLEANEGLAYLIIVSHQKVFECISEKLTNCKKRLPQGGIAHFIADDNESWRLEILETDRDSGSITNS